MRFPKPSTALAVMSALAWSGSVVFLVLQLHGIMPAPLAIFTCSVAIVVTTLWGLHMSRPVQVIVQAPPRPVQVIEAAAEWVTSRPVPIPVSPAPTIQRSTGGGATTVRMMPATDMTRVVASAGRDGMYWQVYSDLANDLLSTRDDDPGT